MNCTGTEEAQIKECVKKALDVDDLEMHVYIIYGVFGGLIGLLLIMALTLCQMVHKLKKSAKQDDLLRKRGYQAYTGQDPNPMSVQQGARQQQSGYGQQPPTRQPTLVNTLPPPQMNNRQQSGGYGYDNHGYNNNERDRTAGGVRVLPGGGGGAGRAGGNNKSKSANWGSRFDKGMEHFDNVQDGFDKLDKLQQGFDMADQMGLSQAAFGGNIGDMPGMDALGQLGDVGDVMGNVGEVANFGKAGMGAFKNKGFKKPF